MATVKSVVAAVERLIEVVGINDTHKAEVLDLLGSTTTDETPEETPAE
jgi:hypothetical protein